MPNLKLPLFLTRLSIALFLLPWILMRFTAPDSAAGIAKKYYFIGSMPSLLITIIGVLWVVLWLAFISGFKKTLSYGLVLVIHTLGTLFSLRFMIPGTDNFIPTFMAALPTIMAMYLLFRLRHEDTLLSIEK